MSVQWFKTDKQTDRYRQIDRQTGRQTDRHRKTSCYFLKVVVQPVELIQAIDWQTDRYINKYTNTDKLSVTLYMDQHELVLWTYNAILVII